MPANRLPVASETLTWARTAAGYTQEAAARKIGCSVTTYERWESGDLEPTVKQLRDAASAFGRSLAELLLPSPPDEPPLPVADFRRLATDGMEVGTGPSTPWSPAFIAAARRALGQRTTLLELRDTSPDLVYLGESEFRLMETKSSETLGGELRQLLALDAVPRNSWRRGGDALNATVEAAERLGVIVIQVQRLDLNEMKGFSIAEFPLPIAALNGADYPRPKLFTLVHELAHIGLRAGGVCDLHEVVGPSTVARDSERVERQCNEIAAAALMPLESFAAEQEALDGARRGWPVGLLRQLGEAFGASAEAALLRLISTRLADWDLYRQRKPEIDAGFVEAREEDRLRRSESAGGPSFYTMRARDLGHAYVNSVFDAFASDAISSRDVASLLWVRYDQLPKLRQAVGR